METVAKYRYICISPQKLRLVVNMIRGKQVSKALNILHYINKKSTSIVKKTLESAIANAEHNYGVNIDALKIVKIYVDNGPGVKRTMLRAKGRSDRIIKRTSHLTIMVSD